MGDGTFALHETRSVHSRPVAVALGDFNGDGKPDLAVAALLSSTVVVLFGDGTGSFPTGNTFGVARHPSALAVGDFNNDGKHDVAVANRFSDSISVLLNDTDLTPPTLTMPALAPSYVYNASVTLTFGATDAESGIYSIEATRNGVPLSDGETVVLNHPGTNTFTLTATDKVGNVATQSATFAVLYAFGGFLPPVPNDGSGVFRLNSIIALRLQLTDANGASVSTADAMLTVQKLSGGTLLGTPIDATAAGKVDAGSAFNYYAAT